MSSAIESLETTEDMLAVLRARAATVPAGLIDWVTGNGCDMVRIAVCFGGFDARVVVRALAKVKGRGERLNAATVGNVLSQIRAVYPAQRSA